MLNTLKRRNRVVEGELVCHPQPGDVWIKNANEFLMTRIHIIQVGQRNVLYSFLMIDGRRMGRFHQNYSEMPIDYLKSHFTREITRYQTHA